MNMIKCALQFSRKSNQHCPNHYFTIIIIIIHKSNQIKCQMLVFDERGKPEYPGKNLSWQSGEPTNSIHIWHREQKSNPGHIGGRQVLSPPGQPCQTAKVTMCTPNYTPQEGKNTNPKLTNNPDKYAITLMLQTCILCLDSKQHFIIQDEQSI